MYKKYVRSGVGEIRCRVRSGVDKNETVRRVFVKSGVQTVCRVTVENGEIECSREMGNRV